MASSCCHDLLSVFVSNRRNCVSLYKYTGYKGFAHLFNIDKLNGMHTHILTKVFLLCVRVGAVCRELLALEIKQLQL